MMDDKENSRLFKLHFEGAGTRGHTLPVSALTKSLDQIQYIIFLLARIDQQRRIGLRNRVSHEIERRFSLVCKLPEEGGYRLPIEIGDPSGELFTNPEIERVGNRFIEISKAIDQADLNSFQNLIPDSNYRQPILKAYQEMQPVDRFNLRLSLEDFLGKKIFDGAKLTNTLQAFNKDFETGEDHSPAYIVGSLIRMQFDKRSFQLKLQNGRSLEGLYSDAFEPTLVQNPRELIQVHGNVTYDANGAPESLTDVDEILEIDESPIEISEVFLQINKTSLKAEPPLIFKVVFHRDDGFYELSGDFDIELSSDTRPALEESLNATLEMIWFEYAKDTAPEKMTLKARELAQSLRGRLKEVLHA